jgi:hypothetical protein
MSQHTDPHTPSTETGYETTDVHVPIILRFGVILTVMMALAGVGSWVIFQVLFAEAKRADPKLSPLAVIDHREPPEPRLLHDEPNDLAAVEAQEREQLESYGWVDRSGGVVRIPIERAMELVAKDAPPGRGEKPR